MKHRKNEKEVEMREIAGRKPPYNPKHTRNLFLAGMVGLLFITVAVLLYIL